MLYLKNLFLQFFLIFAKLFLKLSIKLYIFDLFKYNILKHFMSKLLTKLSIIISYLFKIVKISKFILFF